MGCWFLFALHSGAGAGFEAGFGAGSVPMPVSVPVQVPVLVTGPDRSRAQPHRSLFATFPLLRLIRLACRGGYC
jgi:hypothetical protein